MTKGSIEKMQRVAGQQDDQQLIERLSVLEMKAGSEQDELLIKTSLYGVLEERHGRSEVEQIKSLIKNKLTA